MIEEGISSRRFEKEKSAENLEGAAPEEQPRTWRNVAEGHAVELNQKTSNFSTRPSLWIQVSAAHDLFCGAKNANMPRSMLLQGHWDQKGFPYLNYCHCERIEEIEEVDPAKLLIS